MPYHRSLPPLSVVIPAYNEERRLPDSLDAITAYLQTRGTGFEIIVVDDGSTDSTAAVAEAMRGIRLLRNPGNRGKGFSVKHGMLEARNDWILSTDADLSAPIEELDSLFRRVTEEHAEVAIGSRALDRSMVTVHQPRGREWAGIAFNFIMRSITGLPYRDTQCGFKLFSRSAARRIFPLQRLDGFGFDVEDLYIAKLLGIRVVEVPVHWRNVEGTKVSLRQGLNSCLDPLRIRWHDLTGKYAA
jgi:glycosyltransferase involved in cell wall biosynthesis